MLLLRQLVRLLLLRQLVRILLHRFRRVCQFLGVGMSRTLELMARHAQTNDF